MSLNTDMGTSPLPPHVSQGIYPIPLQYEQSFEGSLGSLHEPAHTGHFSTFDLLHVGQITILSLMMCLLYLHLPMQNNSFVLLIPNNAQNLKISMFFYTYPYENFVKRDDVFPEMN